jgi:hypothetical protein
LIRHSDGKIYKGQGLQFSTSNTFGSSLIVPNVSVASLLSVGSSMVSPVIGADGASLFKLPLNQGITGDVLKITDTTVSPFTTAWGSAISNSSTSITNLVRSSSIGKTKALRFSLPINAPNKDLFLQCTETFSPYGNIPPVTQWTTLPEPTDCEYLNVRDDIIINGNIHLVNPSISTTNQNLKLMFRHNSGFLFVTNNGTEYNPSTNLMTLSGVNVTNSLTASNATFTGTIGRSTTSQFSTSMTLGDDVYEVSSNVQQILQKVYILYDKYVGEEKFFPVKNGAPRIMTKYKDVPYSYELQPEYAVGNKKFPCVKAMDWNGKKATAQVIRGL